MVAAAGAQQRQVSVHRRLPDVQVCPTNVAHQPGGRGEARSVLVDVIRRLEQVWNSGPRARHALVRPEDVTPVRLCGPGIQSRQHIGRNGFVALDHAMRLELEVGEDYLVVERADDVVDGMLEEANAFLSRTGVREHVVEQQRFGECRRHLGHENGVVRVHERLRLVREQRVHRVAQLVRRREDGVEGAVVVHQDVRLRPIDRRRVGAAALALVFEHVDPPLLECLPDAGLILGPERGHRVDDP